MKKILYTDFTASEEIENREQTVYYYEDLLTMLEE